MSAAGLSEKILHDPALRAFVDLEEALDSFKRPLAGHGLDVAKGGARQKPRSTPGSRDEASPGQAGRVVSLGVV